MKKLSAPDIWDNTEESTKLLKRSKYLKNRIKKINRLFGCMEDISLTMELIELEPEMIEELEALKDEFENLIVETETSIMLNAEFDSSDCIFSIHSGTGGLDAQDWAEMLFRMYTRFFEKKEYKYRVLDLQLDTEAGLKHVSIEVEGEYAYGQLKGENGVHRLVRISPYNSSGKRQTSFASVDVVPIFENTGDIEIKDEDIRIDTYRATGAGGQHVNTTDSAVRITHIPTGVVTQCQNERSQLSNKNTALKLLINKLYEMKLEKESEKLDELKGESKQNTWGSQIRSYVIHPYNMVKDHRTLEETSDVQKVLDGEIQAFINAYLLRG